MNRKLSNKSYEMKHLFPIDVVNGKLVVVQLPPIMASVFKPQGMGYFMPESKTERALFYSMN